jgi:hypothetical protein
MMFIVVEEIRERVFLMELVGGPLRLLQQTLDL